MPSRFLSILAILSVALLVSLTVAWAWSYEDGAPDAYIRARDSSIAEQRARTKARVENLREAARRNERRSEQLRELVDNLERDLNRDIIRHPPFRWVRFWSSDRSTYFLASSCGRLGLVEYVARQTEGAFGDPIMRTPGVWEIGLATCFVGRPSLAWGYREKLGLAASMAGKSAIEASLFRTGSSAWRRWSHHHC